MKLVDKHAEGGGSRRDSSTTSSFGGPGAGGGEGLFQRGEGAFIGLFPFSSRTWALIFCPMPFLPEDRFPRVFRRASAAGAVVQLLVVPSADQMNGSVKALDPRGHGLGDGGGGVVVVADASGECLSAQDGGGHRGKSARPSFITSPFPGRRVLAAAAAIRQLRRK